MPDTRRTQRTGGAITSHNIEEGIRRLRIQSNGKQDSGGLMDHSGPYPDRPGEPDCIYYLRTGSCGYGSNCRFNHPAYSGQVGVGQFGGELPERVGEPDCGYFLKTGTCKYGSTCKYHHPRDRHGAGKIVLNMLGLPMREGERSCSHYLRNGSCKFGIACKFHHPQPTASDEASLQVQSTLPSSGTQYIGGLPGWSLPRATYVADPLLQNPQPYMTALLPPSQGMLPTQGWSTYMGSFSPASSTSILGVSGSNGHIYPMTSASQLPERPDQPECRYFMSTGSCKYGPDCKYNHPRDKVVQTATSSLGPFGLPLRPGHPVCLYYSQYGFCKFGPTCRFDHPLMGGYPYQYTISPPSISILDPSLFTSQRYSPTLLSSQSSPSKASKNPVWMIQTFEGGSKGNASSPDLKVHEDSSEGGAGSSSRSLSVSELHPEQSDG